VRQTDLRYAWLYVSGIRCSLVRSQLALDTKEPITQSAYEEKLREAQAELIPVRAYAEMDADFRERVLLTLEQRRTRGFEDPYILGTAPPEQQRDLDRLFLDLRIVNHELGGLILALSEATAALEWRWRWFEAMAAHAADLALVHAALGLQEPPARLTPPIDLERPEDETFAGRVPRVLKGLRDALVAVARCNAHAARPRRRGPDVSILTRRHRRVQPGPSTCSRRCPCPCFNPHPSSPTGATQRSGPRATKISGFNPHPSSPTGATPCEPVDRILVV
jgi:hypothetical protein